MPLDFQIRRPQLQVQQNGGYKPASQIVPNLPLNASQISVVDIKIFSGNGQDLGTISYRDSAVDTFVSAVNNAESLPIFKNNTDVFSYYDLMGETSQGYELEISVTQTNGSKVTRSIDVMLKGGSPASQSFVQYLTNVFELEFGWDTNDIKEYVVKN